MKCKSKGWVVASIVLALAVAVPAVAGDYKCTADTQACLNQMAAKLKARGWVGLELDKNEETQAMTIRKVIANSPAVKAGFRVGDQLVALGGMRFAEADEAAMQKSQQAMMPGKTVTYTILRDGAEHEMPVTLATLPDDVMAQWIGNHMMEHAVVAQVQN